MNTAVDRLHFLSKDELYKVHTATLDILENTGMRFESEEAREIFKKNGFKVEGKNVQFTETQLRTAHESVSNKWTLMARDPDKTVEMNLDSYSIGMGGGSPFMINADRTYHAATRKDYINSLKIAQSLDPIETWRVLVIPNDLPAENANLYMMFNQIVHFNKVYALTDETSIDLLKITYGLSAKEMQVQAAEGIVYGQITINPISPLVLDQTMCDRVIHMAKSGIAMNISPMPVAGTTAPVTLPATLILQNCEVLATLALTQLVTPGCPVAYGTMASHADMRTMGCVYGSPESRILEYAGAQLARFYGMLSRGDVGLTDSMTSDFQAGAEGAFEFVNAVRAGINFLPGCGNLGSFLGASLEKVVLDAELAEMITRYLSPMDFTAESMAVDEIKKTGPGGNFVSSPHTFTHFRNELTTPKVFTRETYDKWNEGEKLDAKQRANRKVVELLKNYERPAIDEGLEQELIAHVNRSYPVPWTDDLVY
jgi:trimethylamine--corrinoid protein Co-methyltransferase